MSRVLLRDLERERDRFRLDFRLSAFVLRPLGFFFLPCLLLLFLDVSVQLSVPPILKTSGVPGGTCTICPSPFTMTADRTEVLALEPSVSSPHLSPNR